MGITIDGVDVEKVTVGGTEVSTVTVDGQVAFTSARSVNFATRANGNTELRVYKVNGAGVEVWGVLVDTIANGITSVELTADDQGDVYVKYRIQTTSDFTDTKIRVKKLNASDGSVAWTYTTGTTRWDNVIGLTVDTSYRVYFTAQEAGLTGSVFALASNGAFDWESSYNNEDQKLITALYNGSAPLVMMGAQTRDLTGLDSGGSVWGGTWSSPFEEAQNPFLVHYYHSTNPWIYGADPASPQDTILRVEEATQWPEDTSFSFTNAENFSEPPAVDSAGDLYFVGVGSPATLYKLDTSTQSIAWSVVLNTDAIGVVAVDAKGFIYVEGGNRIEAYDKDGNFRWEWSSMVGNSQYSVATDDGLQGTFGW